MQGRSMSNHCKVIKVSTSSPLGFIKHANPAISVTKSLLGRLEPELGEGKQTTLEIFKQQWLPVYVMNVFYPAR